ncbi:hypothetical protein ACOMHN_060636 [Nucella lapillus]
MRDSWLRLGGEQSANKSPVAESSSCYQTSLLWRRAPRAVKQVSCGGELLVLSNKSPVAESSSCCQTSLLWRRAPRAVKQVSCGGELLVLSNKSPVAESSSCCRPDLPRQSRESHFICQGSSNTEETFLLPEVTFLLPEVTCGLFGMRVRRV